MPPRLKWIPAVAHALLHLSPFLCERRLDSERQIRKNFGMSGTVQLHHVAPTRSAPMTPGILNVFADDRTGKRSDGMIFPALSPARLGPVKHGQPDLPDAMTLEQLERGNRFHASPCSERETLHHRWCCYTRSDHQDAYTDNGNEPPLMSLWRDDRGDHRMNHVEARQRFCAFYERLAGVTADFQWLRGLVNNGICVRICGHGAQIGSPTPDLDANLSEEIADWCERTWSGAAFYPFHSVTFAL
jgi:hypothetical protein